MPEKTATPPQEDVWSEWLLHRRHADDSEYSEVVQTTVEGYAKRVLDGAQLVPGSTLVDIGSGEGLIPFRAIERVGPTLRVILTDVSAPMLRYAQTVAVKRGVQDQCTFLECSADRLEGIADSSVDVVTTRAALAYVADKNAAFRECYRILTPGGRISIAEPIFAEEALIAQRLRMQVDSEGIRPSNLLLRLVHRCKSAQFPDTEQERAKSPHVNYSERDLLKMVQEAGFSDIHLELHIDVTQPPAISWEVLMGGSPHPWARPLGVILEEDFTPEERDFFERAMRPSVESGTETLTERTVYLTGTKPLTG